MEGLELTVEQDLSNVLVRLEESTFETFGQTSKRVADGVRDSGVPAALAALRAEQHDDLFSIAVAVGISASNIVSALAQNRLVLESIESALRNPVATAADEYYRRGVEALRRGWIPEAIGDLEKSISQNPYTPPAQAALAVAYSISGEATLAAERSLLALRYAAGEAPGVVAGCAMLAIALLEGDGRADRAEAVCAEALATVPDCAELALAQARLAGDAGALERAIRLAPGMAGIALAAGLKDVNAVIDRVSADSMGPLVQSRIAAESFRVVLESAHPKAGADLAREIVGEPNDLTDASAVIDRLGPMLSRSRQLAERSTALLAMQQQQSKAGAQQREQRDIQARHLQDEIDAVRAARLRWRILGYGGLIGAATCFAIALASVGSSTAPGEWSAQTGWLVIFTIAGICVGVWGLAQVPKPEKQHALESQLRQWKMQKIEGTDTSYTADQLHALSAADAELSRIAGLAPTRTRPYEVAAPAQGA